MLLQVTINLDHLDKKTIMLELYALSPRYSHTDRMLGQPMKGQANLPAEGWHHVGLRYCPPGCSICFEQIPNIGYCVPKI